MTEPEALQGTTTTGLPYPESSDALNQGANAIKALALALDARNPQQRVVMNGGANGNASNGDATVATGLTTCTGAVVSPTAASPVLLTVTGYTGGSIKLRVFNSTALTPYSGGFGFTVMAWGT